MAEDKLRITSRIEIEEWWKEVCIEHNICGAPQPCEDAIGRSDMLDAIGHGTTYTSEELQRIIKGLPSVNPQPKTGCEGCIHEKTGDNSRYPCSHCCRCYTDKYKIESEE